MNTTAVQIHCILVMRSTLARKSPRRCHFSLVFFFILFSGNINNLKIYFAVACVSTYPKSIKDDSVLPILKQCCIQKICIVYIERMGAVAFCCCCMYDCKSGGLS